MSERSVPNGDRFQLERIEVQIKAILTFHSIDSSGSPISMPVEQFTRQLDWMASGKVDVVSLRELIENKSIVDGIALTFDDGFTNVGEIAAPLLLERELCATVFVSPDHVGTTNTWDADKRTLIPELPLLGWEELRTLAAQRIEVGGHGLTHRSLKSLPPASLDYEIAECSKSVETQIGTRPYAFAFPYGDFDDRALASVAKTFPVACTTEMRVLKEGDSPHALPRIDMYYFREMSIGDMWGTPAFAVYVKARASIRSIKDFASRGKRLGR